MWDKIKSIISTAAPALAGMLGTPATGMAVGAICSVLGISSDSSKDEIENALKTNPDALVKLKEIELQMMQTNAQDRDSARNREIKMASTGKKQCIMPVLAIFLTIGFFSLLIMFLFKVVPQANNTIFDIMLGYLGAGFQHMLSYYYGSSNDNYMEKLK